MKTKRLISMLMVGIVATLLCMSLLSTVQATDTTGVKTTVNDNGKIGVQKTAVTDTQELTEKKYKKAKTYTLTFNANGGKITTKTKKLAYNKSLGTLPKPTRFGYSFQGWYTSKSGGKKVSATTKMPAKNMVVYAHWKRTLSASEKKLIGTWCTGSVGGNTYYLFRDDGTYSCPIGMTYGLVKNRIVIRGIWHESGGTIYMTKRTQTSWAGTDIPSDTKKLLWKKFDDSSMRIRFDTNKYTGEPGFVNLADPDGFYGIVKPPSWVYF